MGALKGSISVRRYAVLDPLPAEPRRRLARGVRAHAFSPVDPRAEDSRSVGWVALGAEDDADLAPDKLFAVATSGEQLRVAMRIDVLEAPASVVRRELAARVAEKEAEEGRRLGRRERRLLKEEVARALRLRAFPRVRVSDVVWELDQRRLWFWSQAKGPNEAFVDLFTKSFGLRVEVEGPARWAGALVEPHRLASLEPTRELWRGFDGVRPLASVPSGDDGQEG